VSERIHVYIAVKAQLSVLNDSVLFKQRDNGVEIKIDLDLPIVGAY
jgi:hypothetical protein